jgi:pimeloyl-ACP methyl ester carboxylesterase
MQQKNLLSISTAGFHKIAYTEWGDAKAKQTILCVHGLTRNSRDFDQLAARLSVSARVACPDLIGRGASDWLSNPALYNQAQYVYDLTALIARLDVDSLIWVGTSLGGLLGMYIAAQPNTPIKALVLNDVGPLVSHHGLSRIMKYAKHENKFSSLLDVEKFLRNLYQTQEPISDELWRYKAQISAKQLPDGNYTLAYDPHVTKAPFKLWFTDINLWYLWDKIKCPVLVLRGQNSDILSAETLTKMSITGPKATTKVIPGCGHAPMLMTDDQIDIVSSWLSQQSM